jgi:signal transduction histidine kinase
LTAVRDDSDRLNQIVENLLDMSRIEPGQALTELRTVHATDEFSEHNPPPLPVLPERSPIKVFGG